MADQRVALTRQVKDANDIVAVVGNYLHLTPAGASFKAICPFHQDHRPSLDVDPRRQRYRCWACGAFGDVFSFVMGYEKVDFLEARAILARRVGISLDDDDRSALDGRIRLLEAMRWAANHYQQVLLDSELAQGARLYLGERKLAGPIVRQFGLGYAPAMGDWLVKLARSERIDPATLKEIGLIAERKEQSGYYDRFRDRIMFPIRDTRGQTVGFGGRILPDSPYASRGPKYYNSAETPLFSKSELIYGLDHARQAGAAEGYLAVVEGYTDVLMAHQMGVPQVVATMGTALNLRHINQLRRFVPRVVLVFDADAGGMTGVDRALEIFISQDVELKIATLPDGMDPCDLLVAHGADPFKKALQESVDALDFKMNRLLSKEDDSIESTRRVVDAILGILALTPEVTGQSGRVKQELLITRIAHRLRLREETIWARLGELKDARRQREARLAEGAPVDPHGSASTITRSAGQSGGPAPMLERQLLEILLAEPSLVGIAAAQLPLEEMTHPGLRRLLEGLYALHAEGETPDLDALRPRLNHPALATKALELQDVGRTVNDRNAWLTRILAAFTERRTVQTKRQLRDQLAHTTDHQQALDLLKAVQARSKGTDSSSPRAT
ncbi:DNA primase [Tuwongella immobilis]|uniref:DNA primase n=1 Tax=Tuwongella immobilis TaxID=692036 RepID=A0A6C2YWP6_9BACT|nr:DNA primase [Tuwongella immobilis]VIP05282.1 dna primase : DNA primase OS=Planctomyces limnophilus (strain ATCC 43296 / DSM 3776 / IFAM 1008 / 290) GN=Plim_0213 PE=3 SV=1: zf-CHC2: Toprim_N: Toprim_4 [Tuwongella immobilis]VTS07920.1 dna primase : DNA primase OS=Planctomyces limnophilus (strain ATCC 43296 / DSM 3776 / IFAM 1008 / 290) GN=Plim_0213 PE=3 SV=1: zf-CHC2: Toprim_N: Toprim_4 [Tuwongella immobilis]